jgi:hypothetical protein
MVKFWQKPPDEGFADHCQVAIIVNPRAANSELLDLAVPSGTLTSCKLAINPT